MRATEIKEKEGRRRMEKRQKVGRRCCEERWVESHGGKECTALVRTPPGVWGERGQKEEINKRE